MAQNIVNYQPNINVADVRWVEMTNDSDQDKLRPEKRVQGSKMKDEHALAYQRNSRSPNISQKTAQELRENRNERAGGRRDEFVSNLDYFMHSGYPHPNFSVQVARRDSPPELMAVERAKQAFARANEAFFPGSARSMPPELSKFTPEQIEALYKSQNLGISLTISPPELTERAGIVPPGSSRGGPSQRPSPQTERQHGDFGSNLAYMGMDEKLLRIAEVTSNLQKAAARSEMGAQCAGLYPGMVRLPPSAASQVQNFQNQQNSLRFNQDLMRQVTAGFPFGIDPRLLEHSRAYQQMAANARNEHSPNDGTNQPTVDASSNESAQKKSLHPSRPVALGKSRYLCVFGVLLLYVDI